MARTRQERTGDHAYDSEFPLYHLEDLKSSKTPRTHFLMGDGWLKRGGGLAVIGATGVGKSIKTLQLAVCLAAGIPYLGISVPRPICTLYLEAENDRDILRRDLVSIVKHLGADPKLVQKNLHIRHIFGVTNADFAASVAYDIDRFSPDVIVVDPYQDFVDGDINKAGVFRDWIRPLNKLIKPSKTCKGIGLVLSIHTGKPRDVSDWDTRAMAYIGAGTSAMANWARSSCELFPCKNDIRRFRLHFSKGAEYTTLQDPQGSPVRDMFIEHSLSAKEPYWAVCSNQMGEVKMDYKAEVVRLAYENPKWSMRKLAEQLHVSVGVISRHYPEDLRKKGKK